MLLRIVIFWYAGLTIQEWEATVKSSTQSTMSKSTTETTMARTATMSKTTMSKTTMTKSTMTKSTMAKSTMTKSTAITAMTTTLREELMMVVSRLHYDRRRLMIHDRMLMVRYWRMMYHDW